MTVTISSWLFVIKGAGTGMSTAMMTGIDLATGGGMRMPAEMPSWTFAYAIIMFFMWWIMMIAMMLPSASPTILLFARARHDKQETDKAHLPSTVFASGYLLAWTEGDCKAAIAMRIDSGEKDGVSLNGLSFVVLLHSPGPMVDGNIKVGLIIDENADDAQADAIGQIASGSAGGPMAALAPLVGEMAGIEKRAITIEGEGLTFSLKAGELVNLSVEGLPGANEDGEPIYLEHVPHPANSRLALAKATNSEFHAFGIDWDDSTGLRNGHFQKFSWAA